MNIHLKEVTINDLDEVLDYKIEMKNYGSSMDGTAGLEFMDDINQWYNKLQLFSNVSTCPNDKSPSTQYLIKTDNKLVGMLDIRHNLNHPILKLFGGHIGYSIRPTERRKGYATEALKLALTESKKLGINKVMISCLKDNIAYRKVIISNGGIFDHDVNVPERNETFSIFYIGLK